MNIPKRWRHWVIGGLAVLILTAAVLWLRPYYLLATAPVPEDRCPGHERFDPGIWRDTLQAYAELAPRGCMVDDLLGRTRFVGMQRDEVVRLLGEPTRTAHFDREDLVYWLGPERGLFSIDSEWLVMKLNRDGRVIEAKIMTD
jgi:hypothetical protein